MRLIVSLVLAVFCHAGFTDEALDAELDQEWGHKKIEATTVESPKDRYAARLKMLTTARANAVSHCSHSGDRYCKNYAEEQYRRDKRGLAKEFGELDPEDKLEEHDHEKKIFDRGH